MSLLRELQAAKTHLVQAYLNQVGVEEDEAFESMEGFCRRHCDLGDEALISAIYCEAARYEDM